MHIMHVVGNFGPGGAEMGVVRIIKAMSDTSICHSICSISSDLRMKYYLPETVNCYSIGVDKPNYFAFKALSGLFKKTRVDIAHVNNIAPWFDVAVASRLSGCKCIQTFHGVEDISHKFSLFKKLQIFCSWKLSHHLGAVSQASADLFTTLTGIDKSCVAVINNGIDTNFFSPEDPAGKKILRKRLGLPEDHVLLGCVAALRPVKNHNGLLTAFERVVRHHPNTRLVLVGDGMLRQDLQKQCSTSGISDHVIFAGQRDEIDQYLKSFDIFVLNSKTEGLSYALLEAMACGLPVVATDVGGNSQLIENGKDGYLYPDGDEEALCDILIQLIGNPDDIIPIGDRARQKILADYSLKYMIKQYFTLYSE
ncbi:MAG: glycosyltransferase, partial [Proteobacteria bacterium]|nr:glycosyltransferase [Pseudomonadota bacterium]